MGIAVMISMEIAPQRDRSEADAVAGFVRCCNCRRGEPSRAYAAVGAPMVHRCSREMKNNEKRKDDIMMMVRCFSNGMARWLSTHLVTYAVTALVPGHMASTDASKPSNHFWGLLYICVQPLASFSSPGRHKTHACFRAAFEFFLKVLQRSLGPR